jgi:hypothetical protein
VQREGEGRILYKNYLKLQKTTKAS